MKKTLLFPILLSFLLPLSSCGEETRINNLKVTNPKGALYDLRVESSGSQTDLTRMIVRKQSFFLFVRDFSSTISQAFQTTVHSYIKNTEELIYAVDAADYNTRDISLGLPKISYPTILVLNRGEVIKTYDIKNNFEKYDSLNEVTSLFSSHLNKNYLYLLTDLSYSIKGSFDYMTFTKPNKSYEELLKIPTNIALTYVSYLSPITDDFLTDLLFPLAHKIEQKPTTVQKTLYLIDMTNFTDDTSYLKTHHLISSLNPQQVVYKESVFSLLNGYKTEKMIEEGGSYKITQSTYFDLVGKTGTEKKLKTIALDRAIKEFKDIYKSYYL